ncbi:MAG: hypothetical protein GX600_01150, partial [Dehalococcoidia bacterium]|nr:hypothetical protein [Dehalococcoidia bacterium]
YLFESELEQRFVAALHERTHAINGIAWDTVLHNGKPCQRVEIAGRTWVMEQQVNIGVEQGITAASRADFVFWPVAPIDGAVPVAVYTDGYEYHVKPGASPGMVADDVRKRAAIVRSRSFAVWSVTWQDVVPPGERGPSAQSEATDARAQIGAKASQVLEHSRSPLPQELVSLDAVDSLIEYLKLPSPPDWRRAAAATATAIVGTQPQMLPNATWAEGAAESLLTERVLSESPPSAIGDEWGAALLSAGSLRVLSFAPRVALAALSESEITAVLRLLDSAEERGDEGFRDAWRTFWNLLNVLQFLPALAFTTSEALEQYGPLVTPETTGTASPGEDTPQSVLADMELCESRCRSIALAMISDGYATPVVGYELLDAHNAVAAEAELAWPEQMVAVLVEPQLPHSERFTQAGWTVLSIADLDQSQLRSLIGEEQTI